MRHFDDGTSMVTFYCEDCAIEFDVEGTVERTDDEGGIVFVPFDLYREVVYCPNDRGEGSKFRMIHDISLIGAA